MSIDNGLTRAGRISLLALGLVVAGCGNGSTSTTSMAGPVPTDVVEAVPGSGLPSGAISFLSDRDGSIDVYLLEAGSNGPIRLTEGFRSNPHDPHNSPPSWSPDGRHMAVASDRAGNWEIYVVDLDGSEPTRLTQHVGADSWPAWSPQGDQIAFLSDRDGNFEIYVVDHDGSDLRNLTSHPAQDGLVAVFFNQPAWSPDGKELMFVSDRDGNPEIYVMDADGSNVTRLTNEPANDGFAQWSPDGSLIAFETNRDGDFEVYVMAPDGTGQRNVTNNAANDFLGGWSPDSDRLVTEGACTPEFICDIYVIAADGSGGVPMAAHPANDIWPAWSPDGQWIAFTSERDTNPDIYVVSSHGSEVRQLTALRARDFRPNWQPAPIRLTRHSRSPSSIFGLPVVGFGTHESSPKSS